MNNNPKEYQKYFTEISPKLLEVDFKKCPSRLIFEHITKEKLEIFKRLPYYYSDGVMLINKSASPHRTVQGLLIALWSDNDEGIIQTHQQLVEKYGNVTWDDAAKEQDETIKRDMVLNILSCDILECKGLKKIKYKKRPITESQNFRK